ncbi:MAG: hypothetical protein K2I08_04765 [Muribaculaceae bacterium]|nr:hypothetical protein [Muribaculaceae bacterium]
MREKDLEKCLDNLIIKGLIQEAEQDNAEFEAAMREMSEEDFLALIYEADEESMRASMIRENKMVLKNTISMEIAPSLIPHRKANFAAEEYDEWDAPTPLNKPETTKNRQKVWKIWSAAIASVAAILLIVFIPAYREMDSRLCESALLASATYMPPSRGGDDIVTMPKDEVKALLPELKMQYSASLKREEGIQYMITPEDKEKEYYNLISDPQEAGMELVQAYLRLNKKEKAIEVLRQLSDKYGDSEFGEHCKDLLEILE